MSARFRHCRQRCGITSTLRWRCPAGQAQRACSSLTAGPPEGSMKVSDDPKVARDRVTLADIAAAAGVSVPTVSKVLNGHADVAPKTRTRIEALLADYNYAGLRRGGRSYLIDLVFADLSPWAVEITKS